MLWQTSMLRGAPVKVSRSTEVIHTSTSYNQPNIYQPGSSTGRTFEKETHQSSSTLSSTLLSGSTERSQSSFSITAITPKSIGSTLSPSHSVQTSINTKFSVDQSVQTALNTESSSDEVVLTSSNTISNIDQSAKITVDVNPFSMQTTEKANMSVDQSFSSTNSDGQTITRILDEPNSDGTLEITNNFDFSSKSEATDATTSTAIVSHDTIIRRLVKRSTEERVTNEMPRSSSSTLTPATTATTEISTAGGTSTSGSSADISHKELSDDTVLISFFTSMSKSRYLSVIARSLSAAADLSKKNAMNSCTAIHSVPQSICEQIFNASMLKQSENVTCTNIKNSFTHALQMIKSAWDSASYFFSSAAGKYPFMTFLKTAAFYIEQIGSVSGLPIPSTTLLPTGTPVPDYDRDLRFLGELYSQIKLVDSIMVQIRSCFSIS